MLRDTAGERAQLAQSITFDLVAESREQALALIAQVFKSWTVGGRERSEDPVQEIGIAAEGVVAPKQQAAPYRVRVFVTPGSAPAAGPPASQPSPELMPKVLRPPSGGKK